MASFRADPTPLTSGNARVKAARKLARRVSRAEQRLFLADGPKAVEAALGLAGCAVEVFATPAATTSYGDLVAAAEGSEVAWRLVDDRAMASLSDAVHPQGVLALCRFVDRPVDHVLSPVVEEVAQQPSRNPAPVVEEVAQQPSRNSPVVEEVAQQPSRNHPRLVTICADVRDPGNAGTVIRTSDAAGAAAVLLAGNSVDAYNPKTVRATVGSLFHLPLALVPEPADAVRAARAAGLQVLAAEGGGELDLDTAADDGLLARPTAWLFGNEAWGLPEELAELADHRVAIPIHGRAESLNLSTAAAVCLYASARAQRR